MYSIAVFNVGDYYNVIILMLQNKNQEAPPAERRRNYKEPRTGFSNVPDGSDRYKTELSSYQTVKETKDFAELACFNQSNCSITGVV